MCVCVCSCLTYTLVILHFISRRTDTPEGSIQILTGSRRTGARQTHTLVDICEKQDNAHIRKCMFVYVRQAVPYESLHTPHPDLIVLHFYI